ncbi:MAG: hypothetical protein JWO98_4755 [Frankiales bacterium]|nr:hypothetical protein [Frankiales bacterium]
MSTPLERAEQAVWDAKRKAIRGPARAIDALVAAVEARHEARLREAAGFAHLDDRTRKAGHYFADVIAGWPTGSRIRFGPGEGLAAPADACQFHAPAGDPCAADGCGHAAGADCHPRRTA